MNHGIKITLIGMAANLFLAAVKFVGGIMGKSTAMVADAFHSLSDLLTDVITLFTHFIGQIPKDEGHPYGHGRAETIGALAIGIIILAAAGGLLYNVGTVISSQNLAAPKWIAAGTALVSIIIKEILFHATLRIGNKVHSPSIVANAWHHRSDAISSIASLIGILGAIIGYPILDPAAGGVVALLIGKAGFDICKDALEDLMDASLDDAQIEKITQAIKQTEGIKRFHDLRTRRIGGEILIDVHILVDPLISVTEGHQIAERVRHNINQQALPNIQDTLVHVDAEDDRDQPNRYTLSRSQFKTLIESIILKVPHVLGYSQLYIHYLGGKTRVELILKTAPGQPLVDLHQSVASLKEWLEDMEEVDEARIYLDIYDESTKNKFKV